MLIKKENIPFKKIATIGILPSFFKKTFYRLKGYKIGKNVSIGFGSVILGTEVEINDNTTIGFLTVVRAKSIKIGKLVKIGSLSMMDTEKINIGDDSRINEYVYVGGLSRPESELRIGKRCLIMQYSFLNPTKPIFLEDDVALGGLCCIFTHSSWQSVLDGYPVSFAPVTIRKNVWIAWRVFILPGVEIGENSTIAADSTVTADIPPHSLASGSPAKPVLSGERLWPRKISETAQRKIMDDIHDEFTEHLNFNGFPCKMNREKNRLIIAVKSPNAIIYYFPSKTVIKDCSDQDVCVSFKGKRRFNDSAMCLNIMDKQRWGSNSLGEEYVRFLSRYGIRFRRMD